MDLLPVSEAGELDTTWLAEKLGVGVKSAKVREMVTMGGLAGSFNHLDIVLEKELHKGQGTELTLVLKTTTPAGVGTSKTMGLWREALFYNLLAPRLPAGLVPRTYFAVGDAESGKKAVVMEDLASHVPAGVFFGPGNPNNWAIVGKLDEIVAKAGGMDGAEVASAIFKLHARLHAQFWRSKDMLEMEWLQGTKWLKGEGEDVWQKQQVRVLLLASRCWAVYLGGGAVRRV